MQPAADPPPVPTDPATRAAALLRQNPWLARFWSGLNAAQQSRVAQRLQAGNRAMPPTEIAAAWDRMGLADRVSLVYGDGA
jgi:hypothetical protein